MNFKSTANLRSGHGCRGPLGRQIGPLSERRELFKHDVDYGDKWWWIEDAPLLLTGKKNPQNNDDDGYIDVGKHGESPEADESESQCDLG